MSTFRQFVRRRKALAKGDRRPYNRSPKLEGCPQKRGICVKVGTTKPKKPNSAVRKIAKVRLSTGKYVRAAISGQGFILLEHSIVIVKANRVRDIPGVHYRLIRGLRDFVTSERTPRENKRSKHAVPRKSVQKKTTTTSKR